MNVLFALGLGFTLLLTGVLPRSKRFRLRLNLPSSHHSRIRT